MLGVTKWKCVSVWVGDVYWGAEGGRGRRVMVVVGGSVGNVESS